MHSSNEIKGIDNIFFTVSDLEKATTFYSHLGFTKKISLPHMKATLFSIGKEEPGIILCERNPLTPSKLWVQVQDAKRTEKILRGHEIAGKMHETATGFTFEIEDDSGNVIGFADYTKKPELGRSII